MNFKGEKMLFPNLIQVVYSAHCNIPQTGKADFIITYEFNRINYTFYDKNTDIVFPRRNFNTLIISDLYFAR